jgi:hypothetical protein
MCLLAVDIEASFVLFCYVLFWMCSCVIQYLKTMDQIRGVLLVISVRKLSSGDWCSD